MTAVETPRETWRGAVRTVTLGAAEPDGTRTSMVTVGGATTLPFLHFEGDMPHRPAIAAEIADTYPEDWSPTLLEALGDDAREPGRWARWAVNAGADLIALKLCSAHPERGDAGPDACAGTVATVLAAVGVPVIVYGSGHAQKDNEVLAAVAEDAKGERLGLANCEEKNYRTIVAAAMANQHVVVASTPIDVNLAKQLSILISDMGMPLDRVLMDPTTGALGYGLEYTYSVMERLRLAALMGDTMTQQPMICSVGEESWRQKESRVSHGVPESWGDFGTRGVLWEVVTATALLHAGADILLLRHPASIAHMNRVVDSLMEGA